jgi:hypothetical protein
VQIAETARKKFKEEIVQCWENGWLNGRIVSLEKTAHFIEGSLGASRALESE